LRAVLLLQLLLGQDGQDMATEVLPPQLLAKAEAAWQQWCSRNTVQLPADQSSSGSSGKPPGCSSELWKAHHVLELLVHDFAAEAEGHPKLVLQPVLLYDSAGESDEGEEQQQVLAPSKQLLGAWVLEGSSRTQTEHQQRRQQQQQEYSAGPSSSLARPSDSWPAGWPHMLQQPLSLLQCQHQNAAAHVHERSEVAVGALAQQQHQQWQQQQVVVLLCRQEWYSSNEPQQPLGAAMLQLQMVKVLLLKQQQQQPDQEVQQAVESPRSTRLSAVHVPMTWAASLR
jgi:hypothetical protein